MAKQTTNLTTNGSVEASHSYSHPTLLPICFSPANTHLRPRRLRRRARRAAATIEAGITTMYSATPFAALPLRPILKQSPPNPTHQLSKSPDRLHAVHFPPSPTLSRTYVVHSSLAYDRSPISVAPNACALPERGCPGRTYTLDDERPPSPPPKWRSHHNGIHLHPRAVHQNQTYTLSSRVDDDPQRTPTRTSLLLPPPLVPDLSSSESDEGDSFFAPISSILDPSLIPAPSIPRPRARGDAMIYTKAAFSEQSHSSYDSVSPFLPNPTFPDDAHKARRRKLRDRSRSRERPRETRSTYTSDEGSSDGGYTPFSHSAGYSFNAPDDGCLGGF